MQKQRGTLPMLPAELGDMPEVGYPAAVIWGGVPYMDKIIHIIVSLASPDQIILFGSYARGDNTAESDIDLLIVKKGLKNGREISGLVYKAFFKNDIGVSVDLLTIDYNRYIALSNEIGYIYRTIKKEGKVIYER